MNCKYLEEINFDQSDTPWNWNPKDERQLKWAIERNMYGFDSRETWSLNYTFSLWLYTRIKMYKEKASGVVDLSFYKFTIYGIEMTQLEAMDYILAKIEDYFTNRQTIDNVDSLISAAKAFAEILPAMWW